ncbi:MAG: hypothetical protein J6U90_03690 [Methanobrevibacter sp.]|nr:hypothetical protein [Methanobrevibacter sp.]
MKTTKKIAVTLVNHLANTNITYTFNRVSEALECARVIMAVELSVIDMTFDFKQEPKVTLGNDSGKIVVFLKEGEYTHFEYFISELIEFSEEKEVA